MVAIIILSVFCFIFLCCLTISIFITINIARKYKTVVNMFEFYDSLLNELIQISATIDNEATTLLNNSLIEGIPEVKQIFMYVRKIRDKYRSLSKKYNNENKFGNKLFIEE